jgi:hypothetical protein
MPERRIIMEYHPRVSLSDQPLLQTKIILGSFPTWSLARSKDVMDNQRRTDQKEMCGELDFFYGSSSNHFWSWYRKFFDQSIKVDDIKSIKSSLEEHEVGITDMILSCQRKGTSALDKHLTQRIYNYSFLGTEKNKGVVKILCTSKAVMNQMLLTRQFLAKHPSATIDHDESNHMEKQIINTIGGQHRLNQPIFRVLKFVDQVDRVECLALPSPGSPFRKLAEFGLPEKHNGSDYLEKYLAVGFDWFKK